MATRNNEAAGPTLERLPKDATHTFTQPTKRINSGDDLTFFLTSLAYRDLMTWLLQLNRYLFPTRDSDGKFQECRLDSPPAFSETVQSLRDLVSDLKALIEQAPPDTGPRRFGNVAFRAWFKLVEEGVGEMMERRLGGLLEKWEGVGEELKVYLLGSFGSAQRLDYGTGHELSFLAFLGCLWKLGAFEEGKERAIVMGVIQPYLELIRKLVLTYTLEPAGSHGVWGLDDHSFIPYIFGSAQYGPFITSTSPVPTEGSSPTAPSPSKVTDKTFVHDSKDVNMYFSAIQFIYDVKRGPFWEHSPVLYDISGIKDGWAKINKGMLKMYAAEVLGKFPVVQHFPFGSLFPWEADPEAQRVQASIHAQQQPQGPMWSMDVPAGPPVGAATGAGAGTKAPWATATARPPQMQAATGMPSTRAPWASQGASARPQPPLAGGMAPTAAPWARQPSALAAPGAAPTSARGLREEGNHPR